jgi:hypothetical protein
MQPPISAQHYLILSPDGVFQSATTEAGPIPGPGRIGDSSSYRVGPSELKIRLECAWNRSVKTLRAMGMNSRFWSMFIGRSNV